VLPGLLGAAEDIMTSPGRGAETLLTLAAQPNAPVACTIEHADLGKRLEDFRDAFSRLMSSQRTTEGFRWLFHDGAGFEPILRDLAVREHTCCEFLDFTIMREEGGLVWEVGGSPEAQLAIDILYTLPQTIHQDIETITREAEKAGLPFANLGPTRSPCC
jgi:hypothetical protein